MPEISEIFDNYEQIFCAIQNCFAEKMSIPALVLIYSTIDSISWLSSSSNNSRISFINWVNEWMLEKSSLPCSAIELYAARCGLLHTLTATSYLNENKGVRKISYAWGAANIKDLEDTILILEHPDLVAVHINDLYSALVNGFIDYLKSLEKDNVQKVLFLRKANLHFKNTEKNVIDEFLELHKTK